MLTNEKNGNSVHEPNFIHGSRTVHEPLMNRCSRTLNTGIKDENCKYKFHSFNVSVNKSEYIATKISFL